MGDLSKNLSKSEFACQCGCGFNDVAPDLIKILQTCVDMIGDKIIITSGCRCAEHNKKEGGSINSQHIQGKAADFKIFKNGAQVDPESVANWLESRDGLGIGRYHNRVHLDVRGSNARWRA